MTEISVLKRGRLVEQMQILCVAFGLFLLLLYFILLRMGFLLPYTVYWISLSLCVSPVVIGVTDDHRKVALWSVLVFSIIVGLQGPLLTPYNVPYGTDAIYQYQISETILDNGRWYAGIGTNQGVDYSYYPILPMWLSMVSIATGLQLSSSVLWALPVVKTFLIPAIVYCIFRRGFSKKVATVAAFIYLTAPSTHASAQAFGVILAILAFACRSVTNRHVDNFVAFETRDLVLQVLDERGAIGGLGRTDRMKRLCSGAGRLRWNV